MKLNTPKNSYLFGTLNSPRDIKLVDILMEAGGSMSALELGRKSEHSGNALELTVYTVCIPELIKAGLVECFDEKGAVIKTITGTRRNQIKRKVRVQVTDFANELTIWLDEHNPSSAL